jgi:hypothetical protein
VPLELDPTPPVDEDPDEVLDLLTQDHLSEDYFQEDLGDSLGDGGPDATAPQPKRKKSGTVGCAVGGFAAGGFGGASAGLLALLMLLGLWALRRRTLS